jgi:hypothetical protein
MRVFSGQVKGAVVQEEPGTRVIEVVRSETL